MIKKLLFGLIVYSLFFVPMATHASPLLISLPTPFPIITCKIGSFTATPNSLLSGSTTTLSWTTKGCTGVTINTINYGANGTLTTDALTTTTIYTLSAYRSKLFNNVLNPTQSITVAVVARPVGMCTIDSFTATLPQAYVYYSSYHDLYWTTTGCTGVSINGVTEPTSGSVITPVASIPTVTGVIQPPGTITYTLTAIGGSNDTQTKSIIMYFPHIALTTTSSTPGPQSVALGATNVKIADFDLTLSDHVTPQTLARLYLTVWCPRVGIVNPFKNVRFMIGGVQIGSAGTLSPCASGPYSFSMITVSNSNVSFAANETKTVSIIADIDPQAVVGSTFGPIELSADLVNAYSSGGGAKTLSPITIVSVPLCTIDSFVAPTTTSIASLLATAVTWSSSNCGNITVAVDTGMNQRRYTLPKSGTQTFTSSTTNFDNTLDITLFASSGTTIISKEKTVTIVDDPTPASNQCAFNSVTATPSTVSSSSPTTTLSWSAPSGCIVYVTAWTSNNGQPTETHVFKPNTYYFGANDSVTQTLLKSTTYYLTAQAGYASSTGNTTVLSAKTLDVEMQ